MRDLSNTIKNILPAGQDYLIGYADLRGLLPDKYFGLDYAVVLGRRLDDDIVASIENGPNMKYYKHYRAVNKELSDTAHLVRVHLHRCGARALVIEPTLQDKDMEEYFVKTLRFDFSHKMAATRAGLGWIGKTALFVSEAYGPRVRLVTVLTNDPLPVCSRPVEESQCGSCDLCVRHCPAGAASGTSWTINVDRDDFFNPFACLNKARELSLKNFGKAVSICGKCIVVCPIGKRKKTPTRRN